MCTYADDGITMLRVMVVSGEFSLLFRGNRKLFRSDPMHKDVHVLSKVLIPAYTTQSRTCLRLCYCNVRHAESEFSEY